MSYSCFNPISVLQQSQMGRLQVFQLPPYTSAPAFQARAVRLHAQGKEENGT